MAKAPFVIQNDLTAISVEYKQARLIGDEVLPRVPVNAKNFDMTVYEKADSFTVPDTTVGPKGQPNQVEFGGSTKSASVTDQALDSPVTNDALQRWEKARAAGLSKAVSPLIRATQQVTGLVQTRREKRVADLVFNTNSYATGNKTTLSGTSQWSDYTNSDPHYAVMTALDGIIIRPNKLVLGRKVMTTLSLHPKIKDAVFGTANAQSAVTREQLAALFEIEEVMVGEGWLNTANKGQPVNLQRIWGNHAGFLCIDKMADAESGITFGYTAQFGDRVAGTIEDSDIGMRGGQRVRAGESVGEFVTAPDLGYLFFNAVS